MLPVRRVHRVLPVRKASLVYKALPGQLDLRGPLAPRVLRAQRDRRVIRGHLG